MREHPPGPCTLFLGRSETTGRHGGYSSDGRAPGCGPGCRGFKSRYSPLMIKARPVKTGRVFVVPDAWGTRRNHRAPGGGRTCAAVSVGQPWPGTGPVGRSLSAHAPRHVPHPLNPWGRPVGTLVAPLAHGFPHRRPAGPHAFPHEPSSTGHAPYRSCRALPRRGRTSPAPPERPLPPLGGQERAFGARGPARSSGAGEPCQAAPGKPPGFSGPPPARPPAGVSPVSPGERSRGCGSGPPPRRRCG